MRTTLIRVLIVQDSVEKHVPAQDDLCAVAGGYFAGAASGSARQVGSIERFVEEHALLASG
jgi:hypothetical protein